MASGRIKLTSPNAVSKHRRLESLARLEPGTGSPVCLAGAEAAQHERILPFLPAAVAKPLPCLDWLLFVKIAILCIDEAPHEQADR